METYNARDWKAGSERSDTAAFHVRNGNIR